MFNNLKIIFICTCALLLTGGAFFVYEKIKENNRLKNRIEQLDNNVIQYQALARGLHNDNRVLRLSVDDLRHSNDSLIDKIEKIKKSVKAPKNKPGDITIGVETGIDVSDTTKVKNEVEFKLDTTIIYNDLTKLSIKIEKDSLITRFRVNNLQVLFVYSREEYVNSYKNKWVRFWKFDWKKHQVNRYLIKNSNDIIETKQEIIYKTEE